MSLLQIFKRQSKEEKLEKAKEKLSVYRKRLSCKYCKSENTVILSGGHTYNGFRLEANYELDSFNRVETHDIIATLIICKNCGKSTIDELELTKDESESMSNGVEG